MAALYPMVAHHDSGELAGTTHTIPASPPTRVMICPMADWFLETGVYLLGVALVPAVGLLLVCWGLWGDRSKGRARCPRCWYDMRGSLPSLQCPECGHDAKQERRLYRNHRRWWRTALGVVLVLLASYALIVVSRWYREQSPIQALRRVSTDWDFGVTPGPTVRPVGPTWLVDRLPDGFARLFDRAREADLEAGATDADMAQCGELRHLEELWIAPDSAVTDAGITHLKRLSQLRILGLPGPRVTDAGLAHLEGLTRLEALRLSDTQVTDSGLVHLEGLSKLRVLSLSGTQVTDAGLAHLRGLSQIERLWMCETQVTDAGLAHLRALPELKGLSLSGTQVTDAGLAHLEALPKLADVRLTQTSVTNAGVARLKRALPNVWVVWTCGGYTSAARSARGLTSLEWDEPWVRITRERVLPNGAAAASQ